MVQINFAKRLIDCRIVYYGPAGAGKTSNLRAIQEQAPAGQVGELETADGVLTLTYRPLELGKVGGMNTRFELRCVPGEASRAARRLLLQGADGVVFVADSSPDRLEENEALFHELEEDLREQGLDPHTIPMVLQWNKRDLPGALAADELDRALNRDGAPTQEAIATEGEGVLPTFKRLAEQVLRKMNKEYGLAGPSGGGAARKSMAAPSPASAPPPSAPEAEYAADAGGAETVTFAAPAPAPTRAMAPGSYPPPAPRPSPVPSRGTAPQKRQRSSGGGTLQRSTTVRYYRQMYQHSVCPLVVALSQRKIQEVVMEGVAQVRSDQQVTVKRDNPIVRVRVVIPGCIVTPSVRDVDVTPALADAQFWITPLVLGKMPGARVEIEYEGRIVDTIEIPTKITKQTLAKLSALSSMASPLLKPYLNSPETKARLSGLSSTLGEDGAAWLFAYGVWPLAAILALLTLLLYLRFRPKAGDPIESFLELQPSFDVRGVRG